MKRVIVALLVVAFFAAQGTAFAEDVVADIQAQAEDAVMVEDTLEVDDVVASDDGDELLLVEETEGVVPAEKVSM
ncbi:MAG: hypothetical protein BWY42_01514 [Candidatus Omnitrophica bacterium ADurb.Bin277]|nr:MAG: hypothetical protein BWY42_01514 [Candidatus Omnitrophica bacterium ADurb.Bin277]